MQYQLVDVLDKVDEFARLTLVFEIGQELLILLQFEQLFAAVDILLDQVICAIIVDEYSLALFLHNVG